MRSRFATLWRGAGTQLLLLSVLFVLILFPRGMDLDNILTPDEPIWLARSANFAVAIRHGNFDQTYQYVQPGVTVMWAGTLGYLWKSTDYIQHGPGAIATRNGRAERELHKLGLNPRETLIAGQRVMIIFISLTLLLAGWYAIRLFGPGPGFLGAAILATDPFHIGLSRLLHVDGLFSSLLLLSAVTWLTYLLDGRRRRDLIVAGIALGLTGLTRSLAVGFLPVIVISALIEQPLAIERATGQRWFHRWWPRIRPIILVGAIAACTVVLFWPAMWSSPIDSIHRLVTQGLREGGESHERPIFFNGHIFDGTDPGLLFYPVSLFWRATPALFVGLLAAGGSAVVALVKRDRDPAERRTRRAAGYLLLTSLCMLVVLDLSAKKIDRYVIALIPPLTLIAGWGYGQIGRRLKRQPWFARQSFLRFALPVATALIAGTNLIAVVHHHPYGLSYYTPLFGGATSAKADMMIGWGEGLDQIGETINALPDAGDQRIITTIWLRSIRQYVDDAPVDAIDFSKVDALGTWAQADYFVWYITPDQRGYHPPEMQAYFATLEPVKIVELSGLRYAALYDLRSAPIPEFFNSPATMPEVVPGVRFVWNTLPTDPIEPGKQMTVVAFFTGVPTAQATSGMTITLTVTATDGSTIVSGPGSLSASADETIWSVRKRIDIPAGVAEGEYRVAATISDGTTESELDLGVVTIGQSPTAPPTVTPEPDMTDE